VSRQASFPTDPFGRAAPRCAESNLASPRLASPRLASPRLASPRLASLRLALLWLCRAAPCHAVPRHAAPRRAAAAAAAAATAATPSGEPSVCSSIPRLTHDQPRRAAPPVTPPDRRLPIANARPRRAKFAAYSRQLPLASSQSVTVARRASTRGRFRSQAARAACVFVVVSLTP